MNCQSFEIIVSDLARDQILEATVREQALVHSARCERCSVRLSEEHSLTNELRELAARLRAETPADGVEARLVAEFRRTWGAKGIAGAGVRQATAVAGAKEYRRRYWAYAAAAIVMVALGVSAIRFAQVRFRAKPGESVQVAKNDGLAVQNDPSVRDLQANLKNSIEVLPWRNPARVVKRAASSRVRVARNTVRVVSLKILPPNDDEVTTEFIPIAYSNASNDQEGGQVMRLELPRYAMARFGVPVNVDRYDERVKADVWVGADGLARAIRFVQ